MAFEGLSDKLQAVMKKITGRGRLSQADIKVAMREVRLALLEADVNFMVTKDFVKKVSERANGVEILESLSPGQHVIKIVNEELTELMGAQHSKLTFSSAPPTVYMLCGLQGAGKTTMAAKLALVLGAQGKKVMLAACDIYRPAAIKQLQIVGETAGVPVFEMGQINPVKIAKAAVKKAKHDLCDVVILDTAGRLHIDDELMDELLQIKKAVNPQEILLVIDSMIGQDSVNVAKTFNELLDIQGVILTKLDSDSRGGAALSVKAVTGKPIKYAGIGEKITLSDIEAFHPDRMASRILGMGDVLTLIEKAEANMDEKKALEMEKKFRENSFTLDDYLDQFEQMRNMGGISSMLSMIPGAGKINEDDIDEKAMVYMEAIIKSMTMEERNRPKVLNASRRKRIAKGSGTSVQQVNRLIKQFEATQKMMKQFSGKKGKRALRGMGGMPFGMGD